MRIAGLGTYDQSTVAGGRYWGQFMIGFTSFRTMIRDPDYYRQRLQESFEALSENAAPAEVKAS